MGRGARVVRLGQTDEVTTALSTDRYELTMVDAALRSGVAERRSVFEVFTRRLPEGRRYGVVAGIERLVEAVMSMRFDPADVAALDPLHLSPRMRAWLQEYRFRGDIVGYREGEIFAANSPILTVVGSFADAIVLETVILSILNHDCAVAAAASQMVEAAQGRPLIEMGTRRTDPDAAVAAARAAIIGGFAKTSNLEAGRRFGLETAGTSAHAFVLAHRSETEAFTAQIASLGVDTTLLVDTYDTEEGIRAAVAVAQSFGAHGPGAIRIDSGDPLDETREARLLLDKLGATSTSIILSGDLDTITIRALIDSDAPIDVFGVGTSVVTGDGHPTASLAYKLVAIEDDDGTMRSVAKTSVGKAGVGGRKWAYRVGSTDTLIVADAPTDGIGERLQHAIISNGVPAGLGSIGSAQELLAKRRIELGSAVLESNVIESET